jgi:hypothetical protein
MYGENFEFKIPTQVKTKDVWRDYFLWSPQNGILKSKDFGKIDFIFLNDCRKTLTCSLILLTMFKSWKGYAALSLMV